jgi:hypothetical protein
MDGSEQQLGIGLTSYHPNAISSLSLQHLRRDAAISDAMQPWRLSQSWIGQV